MRGRRRRRFGGESFSSINFAEHDVHGADHGHGIDPEIRDKMFEPFVSSKNTVGVGMGMTVARHALRNLGGEVTMTDTEGGGATAVLMHPVVKKVRRTLDE